MGDREQVVIATHEDIHIAAGNIGKDAFIIGITYGHRRRIASTGDNLAAFENRLSGCQGLGADLQLRDEYAPELFGHHFGNHQLVFGKNESQEISTKPPTEDVPSNHHD